MNILKSNMFEQFVLLMQAIIDGLAVTALVSACYWYTITPVAPAPLSELCKDPVSFETFALLTILATLVAIPVTYIRYQRLRKDTIKTCLAIFKESLLYQKKYRKKYPGSCASAPLATVASQASQVFAPFPAIHVSFISFITLDILVTTVMSALTISGVSLCTTWTYASLIMGCKFFAITSFNHWTACAFACIVCGSMLGCAVGLVKYKNTCREELLNQMKKANRVKPLAMKISPSSSTNHFTLNKILYR